MLIGVSGVGMMGISGVGLMGVGMAGMKVKGIRGMVMAMMREVKRDPARLQQGWWANLHLILILPEMPRAEVLGNVAGVNSPSTAAPRMRILPPQKLE